MGAIIGHEGLLLGGASGSSGDPFFASVSLLLHMNGTNGSTTFTDSSSYAHAMVAHGNAQISTAQSVSGGSSGLFDGNGDYVQSPSHAAFAFGTGDFTIEGFFYRTASNTTGFLADFRVNAGNSVVVWCSQSARPSAIGYSTEAGTGFVGTNNIFPLNTWTHWALVRTSGTILGFMGGVQQFSTTDSRTYATPQGVTIGSSTTASQGAIGNLGEVRVTKGVARYTAGFTPPTAPFPDS